MKVEQEVPAEPRPQGSGAKSMVVGNEEGHGFALRSDDVLDGFADIVVLK